MVPKRNSDPRLRIVFFHGWNTNFDSEFEMLKARRNFQYYRFPRVVWLAHKFLAYSCRCSVDTELIDRKNNATNCTNRILISNEVYRKLSSSFTFQFSPGQWSRSTEDGMPTFCKFKKHVFRNMVPSSLWTVLGRIPLFLRTWCNERPLTNSKSSCKRFHKVCIL